MSYVDEHLLPGERVTYRARRHWLLFSWPVALLVLAILSFGLLKALDAWPEGRLFLALGLGVLAAVFAVQPALEYFSSEYAVTDKRVVVKTGVLQRDSHETLLSKVEAIGVDQTLLGRLFDYGTVTIVGTGGTREPFALIAAPLEFRRQVQAQIVAHDERGTSRAIPTERVERECPWCAERILAKAKVCRFCGRDVEPAGETA